MSRGASDARVLRLGVITLVVMAVVSAATFNLGKFPGFKGQTYYAEFSDASGVHKGNVVQVGGIRVGRVADVTLDGNKVLVKLEIDGGVEIGSRSEASIEVLNLLGEKFVDITPAGDGLLEAGGTIPVERTESAYDIVGVFSDLTTTTEAIDTRRLAEALDVVGGTMESAAPEVRRSFEGIARLSRSLSQRDEELQTLFESAAGVSEILARRSDDLVLLMRNSDLVFKELKSRQAAVHRLLVGARTLAEELRGVAEDNAAQMGPALAEVNELTALLVRRKRQIAATLKAAGPYVEILSNIIGTGPWFDAVAVNLATLPLETEGDPEFVSGFPEVP